MKRLILKLVLLFVLVISTLAIVNQLYIRTNYWKAENNVNKFNDIPYNIELGNFSVTVFMVSSTIRFKTLKLIILHYHRNHIIMIFNY